MAGAGDRSAGSQSDPVTSSTPGGVAGVAASATPAGVAGIAAASRPSHGGNRFSNVRARAERFALPRSNRSPSNHFGGHGGPFQSRQPRDVAERPLRHRQLAGHADPQQLERERPSGSAGNGSQQRGNQHFFSTRGASTGATSHSFAREQASVSNAMRQSGVSPVNRGAGESRSGFGNGTSNRAGNTQSTARGSEPGFRGNEGTASRSMGEQRGNIAGESRGNESRGNMTAESRGGNSIGSSGREGGGASNGGWQKFSPMAPRSTSPSAGAESGRSESGRPSSGMGSENRGYGSSRGYSGSEGRGYSGAEGRGYSGSRPTLNMRQPIATPRGYGGRGGYPGYGGRAPGYGGGRAPSYGGGRAPSFGGGHSAPSSHGGGGSSHGGGGGSHGGGGGHGGHR